MAKSTRLRKRVQTINNEPSMTKQSQKQECDINYILKKYAKTGVITHGNAKNAIYGDFTSEEQYQEQMNQCINAQDQFDNLPSNIRDRFNNDPGKLINFLEQKDNKEEAQKLGLIITPEPTPEPTPTE